MVNKIVLLVAAESWSSFVEGDEESYRLHSQTNLVIVLYELSLLFCNITNTTDSIWADTRLHLLRFAFTNASCPIKTATSAFIWTSCSITLCTSIGPVWPDLAKFRHFGKTFKVLGNFWRLIYYLGKFWADFGKFCMSWGKSYWCKWPKFKNNLSIWSHWIDPIMTDAEKYRGLVGMKEAQKCCIPENVKNGISSLSLSVGRYITTQMGCGLGLFWC